MSSSLKKVVFFEDISALSLSAAEFVCSEAKKAVAARGRFSLALSGGSTPRELYQLLSQSRFSDYFPWDQTHIFWGDERCVLPDHLDSNYRMAHEAFLAKIPIPKNQIYRIEAENANSEDVARNYENLLRNFFDLKNVANTLVTPAVRKPGSSLHESLDSGFRRNDELVGLQKNGEFEKVATFDLTLLGIGPDGHTASIFPEGPALQEKKRWVLAVPAPEGILPRVARITLTFPIINRSKKILFLASLKDKEDVISRILKNQGDLPAARIQALGEVYFYLQGKPLA